MDPWRGLWGGEDLPASAVQFSAVRLCRLAPGLSPKNMPKFVANFIDKRGVFQYTYTVCTGMRRGKQKNLTEGMGEDKCPKN